MLPILAGPSSSRGDAILEFAVHQPLVPGKLYVLLAFTGPTPHGTVGLSWLTHQGYEDMGEPPFEELLEVAAGNLAEDLTIDGYSTDDGSDVLHVKREGFLAGSAVALPGFHERMSSILAAQRLVVGLLCSDELYLADADGGAADEIRRMTLEHEHDGQYLGPTVLLMDGSGIQVLAERQI
ncbi:MAG: hypothetical protein AUG44_16240 [Actinobacteria bacterium 13_1_20CM_3_71_11]|nr:MAG: hypothetical protein AUG44_16240 [Actinobacteria bacterium 13_1_20CM_3_71_11]